MTTSGLPAGHGYRRGQMPAALRIGLLGPLQVRDDTGHPVRVSGRQLRVLLTLPALNAGRVVPAGALAGQLGVDPSAQLEQVYLGILRGERSAAAARAPAGLPEEAE